MIKGLVAPSLPKQFYRTGGWQVGGSLKKSIRLQSFTAVIPSETVSSSRIIVCRQNFEIDLVPR